MKRQADIPFAQDSARLFLPWISMLMVFIAVLILAGGMVAVSTLNTWSTNVSGSMTVQIPVTDDKGLPRDEVLSDDIELVLTVLRTSPGVMGAKVLDQEQMAALMAPWIGDKTDIEGLPLPKVIDVSIDTQNPPDIDKLTEDLSEQVPMAQLDSHRMWLGGLIDLANGCIKVTGFILLLLFLTTAFTVIYAAKTSLSVHKNVISLVHMMGANDSYIAWQYATRTFRLTFLGGAMGLVLALPVLFGITYFIQTLAADFIPHLNRLEWVVLGATPVIFAILAFAVAWQTVMQTLKRTL
ncbi:MAG: cell division protein FtsX [Alphaproteobacteria bacterium]